MAAQVIPIRNPAHVLTPAQVCVRLAGRSYLMAILQAGGVWLIAHGSLWAGLTGFLISYHWLQTSRNGNDHRVPRSAFWYGVGGGLGTLTVLTVARFLTP